MKIIDKTPFQEPDGNIGVIGRVQGALTYGISWHTELEAQRATMSQLFRLLDKGCVLIRNFNLPDIGILIPMILIGPGSLSVILVTPVKGRIEAKGAEWNILDDKGLATPAKKNPIDLLTKLTRAFQKYLQNNNINVPVQVEPVLIASDPGANIESSRSAVRIVRSDAIKQFANAINQSTPILRIEQVLILADLILESRPKPKQAAAEPLPPQVEQNISRAQAIFKASETAVPAAAPPIKPGTRTQGARTPQKRARGLSRGQIILLAGLFMAGCCAIAAAVYILFFALG